MKYSKAVFIDKDGTLIPDIPYNADPALITLNEGAAQGLRKLKANGFLLVVVSNQPGIAHGYFSAVDLDAINNQLNHLLSESGVSLDGFYYCPHHPKGVIEEYAVECACRKPGPELLLQAAKEMNIDLLRSWMIGDILNDVEAGKTAGCRSILIDNGNETEWLINPSRTPEYRAKDLYEAALQITNRSAQL